MRTRLPAIFFLVVSALAALWTPAASRTEAAPARSTQDDSRSVATVSVIPGSMSGRPGQWIPVAVVIDLKPHWHIHTNDPKVPPALGSAEDYIKTSIASGPSADGRLRPDLSRIQWPAATMVKVGFGGSPVDYGVFEGRTVLYLPVEIPADASPGLATLALGLTFQACDDKVCLPPAEGISHSVQISVDPAAKGWPEETTYPDLFQGFEKSKLPAGTTATNPATGPAAPNQGASSFVLVSIIAVGAALVALIIGFVVIKKVL